MSGVTFVLYCRILEVTLIICLTEQYVKNVS